MFADRCELCCEPFGADFGRTRFHVDGRSIVVCGSCNERLPQSGIAISDDDLAAATPEVATDGGQDPDELLERIAGTWDDEDPLVLAFDHPESGEAVLADVDGDLRYLSSQLIYPAPADPEEFAEAVEIYGPPRVENLSTFSTRFDKSHFEEERPRTMTDGGRDVPHGTTTACPDCDSSDVRAVHGREDSQLPSWRCKACGARFDEPVRRARNRPGPGAESILEQLGRRIETDGGVDVRRPDDTFELRIRSDLANLVGIMSTFHIGLAGAPAFGVGKQILDDVADQLEATYPAAERAADLVSWSDDHAVSKDVDVDLVEFEDDPAIEGDDPDDRDREPTEIAITDGGADQAYLGDDLHRCDLCARVFRRLDRLANHDCNGHRDGPDRSHPASIGMTGPADLPREWGDS